MKNIIRLTNYKLFVFDINGTLLGDSGRLTAYTRDVLMRLKETGLGYTLATGKNLPGMKPLADELEIDLPMVLANGSILEDRHGNFFKKHVLPRGKVVQTVALAEQHNKDLVMYIDDSIYLKTLTDNVLQVYNDVSEGLIEAGDWDAVCDQFGAVNKCLVVDAYDRQNLFDMEIIFREAFHGVVDLLHASPMLLEVMPKGISKVTGIERIASQLGAAMNEVMAFGNYDNDVEMLQAAGLGAAVADASPAAAASADLIIRACAQDGPARFLDELMQSR